MAERKKAKPTAPAAAAPPSPPEEQVAPRVGQPSVGETLKAARNAKKLSIDQVCHAIHIRHAQLQAIEENNLEALPGMTYAVGFVRSYANFLGLNGAEIVHRFKTEQGHSPANAKLIFPEPIVESRVPDPMMVGVGAVLALVILGVWSVYSSGGGTKSEDIPPAPVTAESSAPEAAAPVAADVALPVPAPLSNTSTPATMTPATQMSTPATADAAPVVVPAADEKAKETVKAEPVKEEPKAKEKEETKKADDETIQVKKGKSRITLKATATSWVQISDEDGNVVFRKVLRAGEQYSVPDQPGLVLDTANAGGLQVTIDGKAAPRLGKSGDIMRDVTLSPGALKVQKPSYNN